MPRKVWLNGFGMITEQQAADIRRRYDAKNAAVDALPGRKGGWRSWDPKDPNLSEAIRRGPTNEEVGELEVFDFARNRPSRMFGYYDKDWRTVGVFTGQKLGDIVYKGGTYYARNATMRRVRVRAITGDEYEGPCAVSHGQYCRLRKTGRSR